MQNNTSVIMLDTSLIIPNKYQPRKVFEDTALNSLAESIKNYGIINPILVRKKDDKYEIIAGERRFRAAKQIGLPEVPVIVKNADEQQMAELALIENIQRQGLSPIEEAKSYEQIMRIGNQTQVSLAAKLGKSQSTIANKIRLLSLPQEIQDALANKKISERHARSLIVIEDKTKQIEILNRIITEKLTVKETEKIIKEETTENDEIKQAINDILKSLNNKEEEKEDDNMNNGNFFPNYDNNNNMNNNTSLNMMNMQSLNQPAMQPAPEMVMPTPMMPQEQTIQPTQMQPIINNPIENNLQMVNQLTPNLETNNNINPIPNFMVEPEAPMFNVEQPVINPMADIPLFNPTAQIPQPELQPTINNESMEKIQPIAEPLTNIEQQPQNPMVDIPIFNPEASMPNNEPVIEPVAVPSTVNEVQNLQAPIIENQPVLPQPMIEQITVEPNSFDIPVTTPAPMDVPVNSEPIIAVPVEVDRLTQLQEILSANGYVYRVYSNETDNCIIIELPKN